MTPEQMQVRLSQVRQRLNEIAGAPSMTPEMRSECDSLTMEYQDMETRWRAAVIAASGPPEPGPATPERAELRELYRRAEFWPFIAEPVRQIPLSGAEAELRQELYGGDGWVPWAMLLPPEERVDAATPLAAAAVATGSQASVLERVFTRSVAARLGVAMPSVPVGSANYPVMLTGTTASMAAVDTAVDATAGSFTGFTLEPVRLTAAYLFRVEDVERLRNYEQVLRRDLAAVMADAMDAQIINGNGTAPNVNGFYSELTAPSNPGAASTWLNYLEIFTSKVDGLNAYMLSDIIAIEGPTTYQYVASLFRTGATDNGPRESAAEYVRQRTGGITVSSRVPAAASNIQSNLLALTSYPGRNAVAPVWDGFRVITDPYTNAGAGQVRLTALTLWNFKILRETGYAIYKIRTA